VLQQGACQILVSDLLLSILRCTGASLLGAKGYGAPRLLHFATAAGSCGFAAGADEICAMQLSGIRNKTLIKTAGDELIMSALISLGQKGRMPYAPAGVCISRKAKCGGVNTPLRS
jgi:hypothetical protein